MSKRYAAYEVYVNHQWSKIEKGEDVLLEILDLDDITLHVVKAKVAKNPEDLPGADELVLKNEDAEYVREPLAIKILEELDPDEVELPVLPVTGKSPYE